VTGDEYLDIGGQPDAAEEKKQYEKLLNSLSSVAATEDGRVILWHILSECGVYSGGFVEGELAQFLQGQREVGLKIIGLMADADPFMYLNLQKEMAER
jgi:hypothetical protein